MLFYKASVLILQRILSGIKYFLCSKFPLIFSNYVAAGAMRLPGKVDDSSDRPHFLTDGYINKFKLPIKAFPNYDKNGISNIYGLTAKTSGMSKKIRCMYFLKSWLSTTKQFPASII